MIAHECRERLTDLTSESVIAAVSKGGAHQPFQRINGTEADSGFLATQLFHRAGEGFGVLPAALQRVFGMHQPRTAQRVDQGRTGTGSAEYKAGCPQQIAKILGQIAGPDPFHAGADERGSPGTDRPDT